MIQTFQHWRLRLASRYGEERLMMALLAAVAILLRLPNLDESLWHDEVLYSTRYVATDLSQLWQLILNDTPAPLYRIVLFGWNRFFGENEIVLRLPSLLCGIGVILLTYAIAKQYGSPKTAALAALFLCFSPAQVWYSQEASAYAMATCLLLGTVLVGQYLRSGAREGYWYLIYVLVLWAALFTHYLAAIFLLPLTGMALTGVPAARKRIIAINILLGALTLGALIAKSKLGSLVLGQSFLRPFTLFEWWMLFFHWFLHGNSIWTLSPYGARLEDLLNSRLMLSCQIFFLILLIRGAIQPGQAERARSLELLLLLCSLPFTLFLLTNIGYDRMYIERYMIIAMPFFALAIARGAAEFSYAWIRRACITATIVLGMISYAMFLSKGEIWTVYKQNPDARSTAAYLVAQSSPPERTTAIVATGFADFAFYLNKQAPSGYPALWSFNAGHFEAMMRENRVQRIFLIYNKYWEASFPQAYAYLKADPRLEPAGMRSFKGVEVYAFVVK